MLGRMEEGTVATPWTSVAFWKPFWSRLAAALGSVRVHKKRRALRLEETLPLGERRFLALVQWEHKTFLVGVTPHNISLLEPRTSRQAPASAREGVPDA